MFARVKGRLLYLPTPMSFPIGGLEGFRLEGWCPECAAFERGRCLLWIIALPKKYAKQCSFTLFHTLDKTIKKAYLMRRVSL